MLRGKASVMAHWAPKEKWHFTEQKRGLMWQRHDDAEGDTEYVRRQVIHCG